MASAGIFETHQLAIELAQRAISEASIIGNDVDVNSAGCLPPLTASYVSTFTLGETEAYDHYRKLIEAQEDYVDVFLVETISNIKEARLLLPPLKLQVKCFISLTISDDFSNNLRSGESLAHAIDILGTEVWISMSQLLSS